MVRLTDRPDMTLDVYRGRKTTTQQQQQQCNLSYDVAVLQWITSCDHTRNSTWARIRNAIDNVGVSNAFLFDTCIMFNLKLRKSQCKGSYDKQKLTLMIISYEIYETFPRLV